MAGYAKLWSGITESSLWDGSKEARLLFVTLLARADSTGFVEAAPSGLARLANLTRQEIDSALADLTAPDPESKSKVAGGRRVAIVPRGFCVVNYEEHRAQRDSNERREYMREYMREYRLEHTTKPINVNSRKMSVNKSKLGKPPLSQAEAEAEAEAEIQDPVHPPPTPPARGGVLEKAPTRKERTWAESILKREGGCPHTPDRCLDPYECVGKLVGDKRRAELKGLAT